MSIEDSKVFLGWFKDWAKRFGLNKKTRENLLNEFNDIDGIIFLGEAANSNDDEVALYQWLLSKLDFFKN